MSSKQHCPNVTVSKIYLDFKCSVLTGFLSEEETASSSAHVVPNLQDLRESVYSFRYVRN